jgi:hypothetical protein
MLDYARSRRSDFEKLLVEKGAQFYLNDKNAPLSYEPGGEDFVSPVLGEADVMRRVSRRRVREMAEGVPAATSE